MNLKSSLKYVYEVIAIVVGITISFMVDEWREESQNRKETLTLLSSIKEDLTMDTITIQKAIDQFKWARKNYYFASFGRPSILHYDSAYKYIHYLIDYLSTATLRNNGYDQFKSTLNNPVMENEGILKVLSEYYDESDISGINSLISDQKTRSWVLVTEMIPYFVHELDTIKELSAGEKEVYTNAVKEAFNSHVFVNKVTANYLSTGLAISAYQKKLDKGKALIRLIDREVGR